jgi:hypothetical protein
LFLEHLFVQKLQDGHLDLLFGESGWFEEELSLVKKYLGEMVGSGEFERRIYV